MNNKGNTGASKWALIGLFSLVAFMLVVAGYWFYRQETQTIKNHGYDDLKAIADLKVSQVVRWRLERISDARLNSSSPFLRSNIINWIKTPDNSSLKKDILERLKLLKEAYDYENVILADSMGRILLNFHSQLTGLEAETRQLVTKTVSSREIVFGDFFRCPICKQIHLDVAAPVLDQTGKPIAVLILRTDPEQYLYPLIQVWPTASKSAETLLVRKNGNDVLFLNVLRHRAAPALTIHIPMSRADVPAVGAALGKTGLFEGQDYRGVEVLSDLRPIPNSSWFMVAKVDKEEILAEVVEHARLIGFLTLALVVLSGVATAFVNKHQGKRAFQALYQVEREKAGILEQARVTLYSIGDAVITAGADGQVRQMNPVAEQLTGWSEAEALGRPMKEVFKIMNEETRAEVDSPVDCVLDKGLIVGLANHTLLIARDGTERPIADSCAPIRNEEGEITGVVLIFRDQTAERSAQKALQDSEEKYRVIFENAVEGIYQTTPQGQFVGANPALARMLGYDSPEELLREITDLSKQGYVNQEDRLKFQKIIEEQGFIQGFETQNYRKDGSQLWISINARTVRDAAGKILYYEGTIEDITKRKAMENQLQKMSIVDDLTGLYNRRGFLTLAQQQFKVAERNKEEMLLFFADLDNMKWINDTLGHQEGDQALLEISIILKETFRESDIISRIGGDEFAILALDTADLNPDTLTSRLENCLGDFNQRGTRPFRLSLSIGMARYSPDHPLLIDRLIAEADRAMYEQKRNKNAFPGQ